MTKRWPAILAAAALLLTACDGSDPVPSTGIEPEVVTGLFERMDRLVEAMAAERARVPSVRERPLPALAAAGDQRPRADNEIRDLAGIERRLEALEQQVHSLRASRAVGAVGRPGWVAPMRRAEVERLTEQLNSEDHVVEQQGRAALFLLSIDEVIERLGMPTKSNLGQDGNIYLEYDLGERDLDLGFKDGRVVYISG